MTEKIEGQRIPITDTQHLIDLGITMGLLTALDTIKQIGMADRLTGLGVARHAILAAEAQHRVEVMQQNIRLAVKAGVDLDTHNIVWQGQPEIIAEPKESPANG
jgi:hypothetical protein